MTPPITYTIRQGIRSIGIATAGMPFGGGSNMIFLDCMCCDESIMLCFKDAAKINAFTDIQAAEVFMANGWTIKPTRCPKHVGYPV